MVTTDLAADAAQKALQSSGIDGESLDGIIVAHNFGDVRAGQHASRPRPLARRAREGPPRHPQSVRARVGPGLRLPGLAAGRDRGRLD